MAFLQLSRPLAALALAGALAACAGPVATGTTPQPAVTSIAQPTTQAATATPHTAQRPGPSPSPAPTRPPADPTAQPTPAPPLADDGPSTGDDPAAPLRRLVYRREDGLYAVTGPAGPGRLLAATGAGQSTLPWAAAPDGSALAFVRAEGLDGEPGQGEPSIALYAVGPGIPGERKLLELLPPGGVDLTPGEEASMGLLPALTSNQQLAWSPDGARVVVASAHEGQVDLYAVTADGAATRLTDTAEIETMPAWSPDGSLVAAATVTTFGTGAGWGGIGLAVARGDGSGDALPLRPLESDTGILAVSDLLWLDGATLVAGLPGFFGPGQVRTLDIASGAEATIFEGELRGLAWSLYSRALAITAARTEGPDAVDPGLYFWRPGEPRATRAAEGDATQPPIWSPAGAWAAFSADGEGGGVWLVPADPERSPYILTAAPSRAIVWSPDGGLIAVDGELWHRNGSPVDPLPGVDAAPLAWGDAGLYFLSRDEPAGEQVLRLWTETGVTELDRGVLPFDARIAPVAPRDVPAMDPAGLMPEIYRGTERTADGISVVALDPASGAEREVGVIPYEPGGITRLWAMLPSPDGRRVAIAATGAEPAIALYVIEGGQTRVLTPAAADNWPEAWSPDGSRLLALSTRDRPEGCAQYTCPYDLYLIDVDTGAETNLTPTEAPEVRAAWSPDGSLIAFTRGCYDPGNESCGPSLYVMDAAGGGERLLAEGWVGDFAFAPDGGRIAFTQSAGGLTDLYVVPVAGGEPALLAGEAEASELAPRWSPDGGTLAYTRIEGVCQVEPCTEGTYVVAAGGGAPALVREHGERGRLLFSGWSPDGRLLLALRDTGERAWLLAFAADGAPRGEAPVSIPVRVSE